MPENSTGLRNGLAQQLLHEKMLMHNTNKRDTKQAELEIAEQRLRVVNF